jgi:hypothetical protein
MEGESMGDRTDRAGVPRPAGARGRVVSAGNAGVAIEAGACVFVDAFFCGAPRVGTPPVLLAENGDRADLILVTHAHADHLDAAAVRLVAARTGAAVAGPRAVVAKLRRSKPPGELVELEPAEGRTPPASCSATIRGVTVTAFRTYHGSGHNSYLIECGGLRFYHDGDNERTQPLASEALGRVDAAFVCPWQGSGCAAFLERLAPPRWFLVHLTDEELDEQDAGTFLPGLMESVPPGLVVLRPGASCDL